MATSGLYGQSSAGIVSPQSGSESSGLYGNNTVFGGTYFEWFIFQVADVQPATPTGGSWSFTTNSGTPPTGWLASPPANPTNTVWVSVGLVNSKSTASIEWSAPGKFSFASGLPILSGASAPTSGDGQSDQLYIETGTTPETIWFKQAGTWTRLTGQTLYVDLVNTQSIGGVKTFTQTIQGSISGNAANVTGVVTIDHGGTGATTASAARTALGAAASGANSDITSLSGLTNGITTPDYITFDVNPSTVPTAPGSLYWDSADGNQTLSLVMAGGTATQQIGEEQYYRIKASAAITDGQVVMFTGTVGASGALTGAPASGLTASTASYVMGVATQDIPLNGWGYVTSFGLIRQINTNAWPAGTILYYDPTVAGGLTSTIPSAPNAKVQVCAVIHQSASNGSLFIRPSFGGTLGQYEGDVGLTSLAAGDVLIRNAGNTVWENKAQSNLIAGNVSGTVAIANGGTGQTTANAAFNALAPSQTGNSGKYLTTDGSNTSWATNPLGTVTSVNASGGTTGLTFSGGPITTSGTLTLAGTLAVANGGTGITSFGTGVATALGTNVGTAGSFVVNGGALGTPSSGTVTNLTGTASININGTVGATTPSTGAFTTLAASSTVTLSGGTANGVAYLNGSKVVTSGSALTFDGTNLGLGVTPSAWYSTYKGFDINTFGGLGASTARVGLYGNTYFSTDSNYKYKTNAAATMYLQYGVHSWHIAPSGTAGDPVTFTQAMTLDASGNLGIGTSSPGAKLEVSAASNARILTVATGAAGTSNGAYNDLKGAATTAGSAWYRAVRALDESNNLRWAIGQYGAPEDTICFYTGTSGTERMRLDNAGNLGLGVTPSSWGSFTAIEGTSSGNFGIAAKIPYVISNAYFNGSAWAYKTTAAASNYYQNAGNHYWNIAGSGTAGAAITFTQAMTLDASGNLGIGTSSPSTKLEVTGYIKSFSQAGTSGIYAAGGWANVNPNSGSEVDYAGAAVYFRVQNPGYSGDVWINKLVQPNGYYVDSADLVWNRASTQMMRLTTNGNLGLGVTPSAWRSGAKAFQSGASPFLSLWEQSSGHVNLAFNTYESAANTFTYTTSSYASRFAQVNGQFQFYTAPSGTAGNPITFTQAMTLDASGNLGVGATSPSAKLDVSNAGTGAIRFNNTSASISVVMGANASVGYVGTQTNHPLTFSTNDTERARIDSSGNLLVGTTSTDSGAKMRVSYGASQNGIAIQDTNNTNNTSFLIFQNSTPTNIGSVSRVGTTNAVIYNTTSDYRLKTVIGPVSGYKERIAALEPIEFEWKEDGTRTRGFLAHKFQESYAHSVTGEKDAVDENGNPVYQAMQAGTSEVIADLVALLQEQQTIIQQLQADVAALKGN